jgi:hypothetical protein
MLFPVSLQANVTRGWRDDRDKKLFLAWALFSGGVTLSVALLILLFNAIKYRRIE